jgi:protein transport protein SEC24
MAPEHDFYRD